MWKKVEGTVLHGKKTITNSKLKDTMGTMAFDPSRGSWIWVGGQPVCNSEVQDSQGHIARLPLLKKENEKSSHSKCTGIKGPMIPVSWDH